MTRHPKWVDIVVIYFNMAYIWFIVGVAIWANLPWLMLTIVFPIVAIVSWDARYKVLY